MFMHETPKLYRARTNVGLRSSAWWYASIASSLLPEFANVAPNRFHNR
jgi:hypothetical protein